MFFINETAAKVVLIVINVLFIISGIANFSYGANKSGVKHKGIESPLDSWWSNGVLNIMAGFMDFMIGLLGLIGAILNQRILKMISGGGLCVGVLINLCLIISTPIVGFAALRGIASNMAVSVKENFGLSDLDSQVLHRNLMTHQKTYKCCGWSNNAAENIFISSPWFSIRNSNLTDTAKITLPDACCVASPTLECRTVTDMTAARKSNVIYKHDCMELITDDAKNTIIGKTLYMIFIMLLQIALVAFLALLLLQNPDGSSASPK